MQINKMTIAKGVLSFAAISLVASCVDDKYDLTDIDTTSRFTVDNLTVPINLEKLTLKNVIDIDDDDETIKIENGIYMIKKNGTIEPTQFSLSTIEVQPNNLGQVKVSPDLSGIPSGIEIPELKISLPLNLGDNGEKGLKEYKFKFDDLDESLQSINKIETTPISIDVKLAIPGGLLNGNNKIGFKDLKIKLPKGLMNVSNNANGVYDADENELVISYLPVETNNVAFLNISADGMILNEEIGDDHSFLLSGQIGLENAQIDFDVTNVEIPRDFDITIDYSVSNFSILTFSGKINKKLDDINVDPISLNDLPDFLNNPKTNIILDNPIIFVTLENPVGEYGLQGKGTINLTSNFSNGSENYVGNFTISGRKTTLAFCSDKAKTEDLNGATPVVINNFDRILTNGNDGLPKTISVSVSNLVFEGQVNNLPLKNLGDAFGDYKFEAPFAFGAGTEIFYNTTENGWGSDDLDDVNIELLQVDAECTSKLPVDVFLKVIPIDKNGNVIDVEEVKPFELPANCTNKKSTLTIKGKNGKPIKDFDGVIFEATIEQNNENAEALGPNIELELNKLQITVSGYYETDF